MSDAALEQLRAAVERVQDEPATVAEEAGATLRSLGEAADSSELGATAYWAAGLAAREQNDLVRANGLLSRGVLVADSVGLPELVGRIRISLALVLAYEGDLEAGLHLLAAAEAALEGADRARALQQRALLLQRSGRLQEAIEVMGRALPLLVGGGDAIGQVRLLLNRSVARTYLSQFEEAAADLHDARTKAAELGQSLQVAACAHNLAFLHGRRGDLAGSLQWFTTALAESERLGVDASNRAVMFVDRAEVLAGVGLVVEALGDALEARRALAGTGNVVELAETDLLVARVARTAGDHGLAHRHALEASAAFRSQDRGHWAVLADSMALRTRPDVVGAVAHLRREPICAVDGAASLARELDDTATALRTAGWDVDADATSAIAGQLWLSSGDVPRGERSLGPLAARRRMGDAHTRVQGWRAAALGRMARGNRTGAMRAVRAGLRTIADFRTTLAASDLRATVSSIGDELASWLVGDALDRGGPRAVLAAAETWRARALTAPVAPPADEVLERLLGELRSADADRRGGVPGAHAHRARLEIAVRDRARALPADEHDDVHEAVDLTRLASELGDRGLIEVVQHHDQLVVITMADGRARRHDAGSASDLDAEVASMRACLQRLARSTGSVRSVAAARETLDVAATRVGEQLFGGIRWLGDRPAVVVPTGSLHGLPWAALPRLRDDSFVVSPSAVAWQGAVRRRREQQHAEERGRMLLVAGPDLPGAVDEIEAIAARCPDALVLTGPDATVDSVRARLPDVEFAHFAAHGDFRTDNPQLSALRLVDGALTVYDLERLGTFPSTIVLSACDAAAVAVRGGDEVLGFAGALLGLGATSLVAPLVPVDDQASADLMTAVHRSLASGKAPSEALGEARASTVDDGTPDGARRWAAACSFLAIGS